MMIRAVIFAIGFTSLLCGHLVTAQTDYSDEYPCSCFPTNDGTGDEACFGFTSTGSETNCNPYATAPAGYSCAMSTSTPNNNYYLAAGQPIFLCSPPPTTPTTTPTPAPTTTTAPTTTPTPAPTTTTAPTTTPTPAPTTTTAPTTTPTPAPTTTTAPTTTPTPATPTPTSPSTTQNPCYCTSETGPHCCFNFDGASSDTNCVPRGNCSPGYAAPGTCNLANGGPVYQCSS